MERRPASVWPLGSFLAEEMQARGWTTDDVVRRMPTLVPERDLMAFMITLCVHKDGLLIGDKMFYMLAAAFNVSEEFLRNLDKVWRDNPDAREPFECPDELFGPISRLVFSNPPGDRR